MEKEAEGGRGAPTGGCQWWRGADKEWEPRKGDAEWERSGETDKGSDARSDGIHDRTQHVKRCSPRNGATSSSLSMKVAFPWFANNAHLCLCNRERERKRGSRTGVVR